MKPLAGQADLPFAGALDGPPPPPPFLWPGTRCRVRADIPGLGGEVVTVTPHCLLGGPLWARTADGFETRFTPDELEELSDE